MCFRRLESADDLCGGTLEVTRWTHDAAAFLFAFLAKTGLLLMPAAIGVSERAAEGITADWPRVRLARNAAELEAMLRENLHEIWKRTKKA